MQVSTINFIPRQATPMAKPNAKQFGTVIGSYGKGIAGAATVNFSVSGGKHCDDSCTLKNNGCYACVTQQVKPSIQINLERKEADQHGFLEVLAQPKHLVKLAAAPWVRFSAFGSIYQPETLNDTDKVHLAAVAAVLDHSVVHFPVETIAKAKAMQSCGFENPRVSLSGNLDHLPAVLAAGFTASCSIAGKKKAVGKNRRTHSQPAFEHAKQLNMAGIKARVCPAIAGDAKCGSCTMCADKTIQVIVYPQH